MVPNEDEIHRRTMEEQYVRSLRERAYFERRRRFRVAAVATLVALLGAFASLLSFTKIVSKRGDQSPDSLKNTQAIASLESELTKLKADFAETKAAIEGIQNPVPESVLAAKQAEIALQASSLNTRLGLLEVALQESPEKALSIPLLRKDLSKLDRRTIDYRSVSQGEFSRLYSQQTWILGGIGTALLAVAGGSITILLNSLPRPNVSNQAEQDVL